MKTIGIANQKGGCGKTTTAINLAGALSYLGRTVLLIDLDPQAHASYGLGITNQAVGKSIYNVLTDDAEKKKSITDCILKAADKLDIIPSNILLSTLEQELKDEEDAVLKLYHAIAASKLNYDYVIIDCPPSLGFLTFNALRAADHIIVPIDMSAFSLMGVGKLLGMLELIKIKINHAPQVSALATLFDRRTKYSQQMFDEISMFFKSQMLSTIIRMNVDLKKAVAKGISVIQFAKDSIGAADYTALGQEILRLDGALEFEQAMASTAPAAQVEVSPATATSSQVEPAPPDAVIAAMAQNVTESTGTAPRETSFNISAPNAKEIYVVGDFNQWKINDESRLARLEGGNWEKRQLLAPGKYKYKFIVDGEWVVDSQNNEREQNSFGTFDSIIKL